MFWFLALSFFSLDGLSVVFLLVLRLGGVVVDRRGCFWGCFGFLFLPSPK